MNTWKHRFQYLSVFLVILPTALVAQDLDSTRMGIHQMEAELHRWDVLKTHPRVPELLKGADMARAGDLKGAVGAFQKAAPNKKSYAYFNLGVVYFESGDLKKSERYLRLSYAARRDSVCLEYLRNARRLLKEHNRKR